MGEDGSFLMELLKIASSNQIRSIKILSIAAAEKSKTEYSEIRTHRHYKNTKKKEKKSLQCPDFSGAMFFVNEQS